MSRRLSRRRGPRSSRTLTVQSIQSRDAVVAPLEEQVPTMTATASYLAEPFPKSAVGDQRQR